MACGRTLLRERLGANGGSRTHDLDDGYVGLFQLSYVRMMGFWLAEPELQNCLMLYRTA
jgi:hypothetical protein